MLIIRIGVKAYRKIIPVVPYEYKVPPLYFLKGEEKPIEKSKKILLNRVTTKKRKSSKSSPLNKPLF